ncbi:MAG: MATE family efflux transporter [Myxococcales bacterium]|nr:MAG: MATE family efflux transporter [Myxococcales bacterium]
MTATPTSAEARVAPIPLLRGLGRAASSAWRGEEVDGTRGGLRRAVLLMALPAVIETSMQSLMALVDVFWITRLGDDAVAAAGMTESLYAPVYAVGVGLSIATATAVGRRVGARRTAEASRAAQQALLLAVTLGAVLGVVGWYQGPILLEVLGATRAVQATGASYASWLLAGCGLVLAVFVLNAAVRGAGDPVRASKGLVLANVVNLVLAPVLVYGLGPIPALGLLGAAVASIAGRGAAAAYLLEHLLRGRGVLRWSSQPSEPGTNAWRELVVIGGASSLQMLITMGSWIIIVRIVASFGSAATAGYTVATRLLTFALFPCWGLASAATSLVAQNLGANRRLRAKASAALATRYCVVYLLATGLPLALLSEVLLRPFLPDGASRESATWGLRILGAGLFSYGYGCVMVQGFNAARDPWVATWIQFLAFWVIELPIAFALAHFTPLRERGAFVAIVAGFAALTLLTARATRTRPWRAAGENNG